MKTQYTLAKLLMAKGTGKEFKNMRMDASTKVDGTTINATVKVLKGTLTETATMASS